jgi:hypothetical protein
MFKSVAIGPYAELDKSSPHPIVVQSILILIFHLCLGIPSGLFPSGFLDVLCILIPSKHATCPAHLTSFDHSKKRLVNSTNYKVPHNEVSSSFPLYLPFAK